MRLTDGCSKFLKLNECLPLGFSVELLEFAAIGNACDSEIIEWNTVYYCLSITNLKDGFNGIIVFTPGAMLIVLDLSNNTCLDRILVDIAQKGREISQIVLASRW